MEEWIIRKEQIERFEPYMQGEGKSRGTVEKYMRDVRAFAEWLDGRPVEEKTGILWREELLHKQYAPVTVNSMLSAVNQFFRFCGWPMRIQFVKIQRKLFRERSRELTRNDYGRLMETAKGEGKERLALLMETICASGIRVSEVCYITVEAARSGRADISLKRKIRTILLPEKLCRKLLKYARRQKIASGEIFRTRSGRGLSRKQIWIEMKRLCKRAGLAASKVFPHNLRHLFATTFYKVSRDLARLADVLGHSNIETTRIYLLTTGKEHRQQLEQMGIVS